MPEIFTVAQATKRLGISRQRINALCKRYGIGTLLSPRLMVLTADDLNRLKARRKKAGRPPKSERSE